MKTEWTKEQSEVISHRGGNMLVSAAAGSGKTAVLIARIMDRILDEKAPIDLDELLVVTFTRDAAREMKERIGKAIAERLEEEVGKNPDSPISVRLIKQSALLSNTQMSTIDSFCKKVVLENFKDAGIDPAVRTIDETEGVIIKKKVLEELLEAEYEKKDGEFINFAEYFARGKSDKVLEDLILQLYRFSESLPDKEEWFDKELTKYGAPFIGSEFEKELFSYCRLMAGELRKEAERFVSLAGEPYGPLQYEEAGKADLGLFDELEKAPDYESMGKIIRNINFDRLSSKKMQGVDDEKKEIAKTIRNGYKEELNKLREDFFEESIEEIEESRETAKRVLKELVRLVKVFDKAYDEEKKKRNVADISDWAHLAIKVLINKDRPLPVARAYREQFAEIMIDEYQDSNLLQEKILTSISKKKRDSNIFMVGDVKQSIYKFRQAKPELFIDKYNRYGDGREGRRIDLHKNFRSGPEVIETVNAIFERTMKEELGGISYDEAAKLVQGKTEEANEINRTEVLIFDKEAERAEEFDKFSDVELEAYMAAGRIKSLMKEREMKFSDIAILLRTNVEWAESFRRIFVSEGIPAVCESSIGYFSAWEVRVMTALLKVIDNPRQDLPLAAVLISPIGGFDEGELAELRINMGGDVDLWTMLSLSENAKAVKFRNWLNEKRAEMIFMPVHRLIKKLFTESNFYSFVQAMPSGDTRAANLDMLVSKAKAYEATSLHGVVHFVRYIDRLQKYEVDFGEAGTGTNDAVRIMSIHKSKGLQYPVVFVSGIAKSMNNQDSRAMAVIHPEYGIGIDHFNIETREKKNGMLKKLIARKLRLENVAEEIRLLYVALTRAEEKLILTAGIKEPEEKLKEWENDRQGYISLSKVNSLLDMAMPALVAESAKGKAEIVIKKSKDLEKSKMGELAQKAMAESNIGELAEKFDKNEIYEKISGMIKKENEYSYPYQESVSMKNKMTVSELKRLHLELVEGPEEERQAEPYIPEFIRGVNKIEGAARGSLYHMILKSLDFGRDYSEREFKEVLSALVYDKKITAEELKSIKVNEFKKFFESSLYKRMKRADEGGGLFRETPFVIGEDVEAGGVKEMVLVQGIIDAWFMEGEDVILMDYKTDRVYGNEGEEELVRRYGVQIENYARALERITGKEPKEKIIYSFSLGKEIAING